MKKILIIDDDHDFSNLIKSLLGYNNYRAVIVNDPQKGMITAEREKPDLILLDVLMSEMSGREVCEALKRDEKTKNIPIIFLTGLDPDDDRVRELMVDNSAVLRKPFESEQLLETITQLLK